MNRVLIAVAAVVVMGVWQPAFGQYDGQRRVSSFSGSKYTYGYSARGSILNRPTISPYLALTDFTGSGTVDTSRNYFTQVRPRLGSRAQQRRQQRSISNLQRNVASLNSRARTTGGQQFGSRTGHPTRFMTYLQYYPGLSR